jgi:hypothetical protein
LMIYNLSLTQAQINLTYQNRTDMIHSDETSIGDTWQACITPNDGTDDGNESCSNNLTIVEAGYPECPDGSGDLTISSETAISSSIVCKTILITSTGILVVNSNVLNIPINVTAENLIIEAGGVINLSGRGYAGGVGYVAGNGPGAGKLANYGGGAGYGGYGGISSSPSGAGASYGSITAPNYVGSGGSGGATSGPANSGGAGGGAVFFNITDTFENNGTIEAEGLSGTNLSSWCGGAGSGGSVYIITNDFSGNGAITANGGAGWMKSPSSGCGGGAGGRIAVYYDTNSYTGSITAYGGATGYKRGGAGTVYLKSSADYGELTIDDNGISNGSITPINETLTLKGLIIGEANITVYPGIIINVTTSLVSKNVTINNNGTIIGTANAIVNGTSTWNGHFGLGALTIKSGAMLTHSANYNIKTNTLNITAVNVTIEAGGYINTTGKGYA